MIVCSNSKAPPLLMTGESFLIANAVFKSQFHFPVVVMVIDFFLDLFEKFFENNNPKSYLA